MRLRFRYQQQGDHTHVRVFMGPHAGALGLCGVLTFRNDEWTELLAAAAVVRDAIEKMVVTGDVTEKANIVIDILPEDPRIQDANYVGRVLEDLRAETEPKAP